MIGEVVMVPVPVSRLAEVYRLLGSAPAIAEEPAAPAQGGWTDQLIARAYSESPDAMKTVFDLLMDNPGKDFAVGDFGAVLKLTKPQMRGVLGAFGHRMHSRYGQKTWPCMTRWDNVANTSFYRMSDQQAQSFKAGRARP